MDDPILTVRLATLAAAKQSVVCASSTFTLWLLLERNHPDCSFAESSWKSNKDFALYTLGLVKKIYFFFHFTLRKIGLQAPEKNSQFSQAWALNFNRNVCYFSVFCKMYEKNRNLPSNNKLQTSITFKRWS